MSAHDAATLPLSLRLFGPFAVQVHGQPLPRLRFRNSQAVLALLALRRGDKVERDWLAGLLWPETAPSLSRHSLRNCLTDLRAALGVEASRLHSPTAHSLALDLTAASVDVLAFDAALAREALAEAVALYRGPLLEGWAEAWVFQERQLREQAYLSALERLAERARARGESAQAESYLRQAVATDPLRESAQRALMQLLAACGNYAAALHCYRELRLRLHRELNAEPDPETRALFERLRDEAREADSVHRSPRPAVSRPASQASIARSIDDDADAPAAASELPAGTREQASVRHHLPLPLTSFIGRQDEIAEIQQLLLTQRLVTLTGAGGCGKSRLALEVARGLGSTYPDGVWFVELAALSDPALVPETVAAALGIREQPDCRLVDTLIDSLRERQLLLLLDNCEHLVGACAALAEALLHACPELRLLATSREPLGCEGEWPFRVPSLSLPPFVEGLGWMVDGPDKGQPDLTGTVHSPLSTINQYEAIRLFAERAAAAQPAFAVTAANAATVAAICRRLDGLPLAIELAAARLRALPLEVLRARLDDMFGLLTGGRRTALPQHRTLRATIDWSYALLTPEEQVLLQRLSVFAGGWSLAAVESVVSGEWSVVSDRPDPDGAGGAGVQATPTAHRPLTTDVLDLLTRLVEKSLVVYEEREEEGRYRLLEMVREYAREKLAASGEAPALARQHLRHFLALAENAERHLAGLGAGRWLDQLEREHDNLRAALSWAGSENAASDDLELGLQLAGRLVEFWSWRGYHREGRDQHLRLLARPAAAHPTLGRALGLRGAAHFAQFYGDLQTARMLHEEDLAFWRCLENPRGIASALESLGEIAHRHGDRASGRALLEESLAIYREQGDRSGIAKGLNALARAAHREGDLRTARALSEESLAIGREVGSQVTMAVSLMTLGEVAQCQGELAVARRLFEESLANRRLLGDRGGVADLFGLLASVSELEGDFAIARGLSEEGLSIQRRGEDRSGLAAALERLGAAAYRQRDLPTARARYEESLTIRRELGEHEAVAELLNLLAEVARQEWDIPAARVLAEESLTIRRKLGSSRETASALYTLGWITAEEGDFAAARALHEDVLTIRRKLNEPLRVIFSLDGVGCMAFWQGDLGMARALFEEALATARELKLRPRIAWSARQLGGLAEAEGDFLAAGAHLEEALTLWRGLEERSGLMASLFSRGWVLRRQGEYPAAYAAFSEMADLTRKQRWRGSAVTPLCLLGEVAADQGDWERAAAHFTDGVQLCRSGEGRHPQALPQCLCGMARVALARERPVRAARLLGAAFALWTPRGPSAWEIEPRARRDRDRTLAAARARLKGDFAAAWAEGQAMPVEQATAEALSEAPRG